MIVNIEDNFIIIKTICKTDKKNWTDNKIREKLMQIHKEVL